MDNNEINFQLFMNHSSRGSDAVNVEKTTAVEDDWNTLFINYGVIAWHKMSRAWRGDQSVASQRKPTEPIISWSNSKADLFSSKEPFDGPVPLSKIVEFLIEVWEEDLKD